MRSLWINRLRRDLVESRAIIGVLHLSLLALIIPATAAAGEWEFSGSITGELLSFPSAPAYPEQDTRRDYPSLLFEPRLTYAWNGGADRFTLAPFFRVDGNGDGRRHVDLREANWLHIGDGWDLTVGFNKVFWGVAESQNLIDIINQDDALEEVYGSGKLGQPMVNLNLQGDFGTISLFILPGFRERAFLNNGARLAGLLPIAADDVTFEARQGPHHIDFAARWEQTFGDWDVGIAHFSGTSREPRLLPSVRPGGIVLVPQYDLINQTSLDLQYTSGGWLWKLEAMTRSGQGDRFFAAVAGFEHTISGVFETGADLSLMVEYNYDGRDMTRAPLTIFNDDLFLGARLALNDASDTSVTVGTLIDRNTGSTVYSLDAERRLGDDWKVGLKASAFSNISDIDPLADIRNDAFIQLRLSGFF